MDPLQSHYLVHEPQILGIRILLAIRQMGQMEEPEYAKPVCHGNDNNIRILFYKIAAIKHRIGRPSCFISAAVDPYYDRLFFRRCFIRLPDVQIQTVFPLTVKEIQSVQVLSLKGAFPIVVRLVHAVISSKIHWRFPAKIPHRLPAHKGNALIRNNILRLFADKGAVDAPDRQLLVIMTVCNPFVLAVLYHRFQLL